MKLSEAKDLGLHVMLVTASGRMDPNIIKQVSRLRLTMGAKASRAYEKGLLEGVDVSYPVCHTEAQNALQALLEDLSA